MKRMKLTDAFKKEIREWRFSPQEESMVMAFCVCVGERMKGRDPADLVRQKPQEPKEAKE